MAGWLPRALLHAATAAALPDLSRGREPWSVFQDLQAGPAAQA